MRRISAPYANRTAVVTAIILAIFTLAMDFWNRVAHNTVNIPTPDEKNATLLIFLITLLMLYGIPLIVALLMEKPGNNKKWPIFEACVVAGGILIGVLFFSVSDLVPYPLDQDVIGSLLAYIAMVIAYTFIVKRLVGCWREQNRSGILINSVGVSTVGLILFVASWMMVYFE